MAANLQALCLNVQALRTVKIGEKIAEKIANSWDQVGVECLKWMDLADAQGIS